MRKFLIKICGLTVETEADFLNQANVDFAGMVLDYPASKRSISVDKSKSIMSGLSSSIKKVAVCVSPSPSLIQAIESAGFDYIQIHGAFSLELASKITIPILRAFNVSDLISYPSWCEQPGTAGFVFDASMPGSGKVFDWSLLHELPPDPGSHFTLLAGGITPDNVTCALKNVLPDGIDVSSGVERDHGFGKDQDKITALVQAVRCLEKEL